MKHRSERVASLIKEELSKIISRELEFPDYLVTIIDVDIDAKLEKAIINFSVLQIGKSTLSSPKGFEDALKILNKSRRHLQYLLMKKINIKPMPEIEFKIDRGLEKAAEIEKILLEDKIKK